MKSTTVADGVSTYAALLGEPASPDRWTFGNGELRVSSSGDESRIAFEVTDFEAATDLLTRRGLSSIADDDDPALRRFAGQPALGLAPASPKKDERCPLALDHAVFTAPGIDAAIALFSGRLGLDLRLVKPLGESAAQLFFRTASTVVEVLVGSGDQEGSEPRGDAPATLWGLAWRTADLDAEHARLTAAGLALSEIRTGRKPGTRVCTVREPALGAPTILIGQTPRGL
ncbi:MAG: VOC family protein [Gordonia sp. (in: high G+C Gram-positive bacteria)]